MALGYELVTHFLDCSEGELLGLSTPTRGARIFARTLDLLLLGLLRLAWSILVMGEDGLGDLLRCLQGDSRLGLS
jgi:hypothetical protein